MIYKQLTDYCDCIKDGEITQAVVDELISLVSMATCWSQEPCETFVNSHRKELVELEECMCKCEIIKFSPFYTPFDPSSFTFTIVKQQGINEELIPISEFTYSQVEGVFLIKPPIPDCTCMRDCDCASKYKMLVEYDAGYDELPECLLPVFCEALQYIIERRQCDCSQCQECNNYDDEKVEVIVYNSATITNQLKAYFVESLSKQYIRQLSQISLCKNNKRLWGVVV